MVAWVDHVYGIGAFRLTGTYPSFIRTTYVEEVYRHVPVMCWYEQIVLLTVMMVDVLRPSITV